MERFVLIPVHLERSFKRFEPYYEAWRAKWHKLETGSTITYPAKPKMRPRRRWIDWKGTTNRQKRIDKNLETHEYFPCYIESNVCEHWGPEEMKWFLDALKVRHIDFELVAIENVLETIKRNPQRFEDMAAFKQIIQVKRDTWKEYVVKWTKDPLSPNGVLKLLYWYGVLKP